MMAECDDLDPRHPFHGLVFTLLSLDLNGKSILLGMTELSRYEPAAVGFMVSFITLRQLG